MPHYCELDEKYYYGVSESAVHPPHLPKNLYEAVAAAEHGGAVVDSFIYCAWRHCGLGALVGASGQMQVGGAIRHGPKTALVHQKYDPLERHQKCLMHNGNPLEICGLEFGFDGEGDSNLDRCIDKQVEDLATRFQFWRSAAAENA